MASPPQLIPHSKVLEELGKLHVQLSVSENNNAQLQQQISSLSKQLQEVLKENAELKAGQAKLAEMGPQNEQEETVSKSNYAS